MALMPVDEALARILSKAKALGSEVVRLENALGRTLVKDVKATRDQPPFASSAMDGYAVRYDDVATLPATLKIAGVSAAGRAFKGKVKLGQAVRILTGAPLPSGADTVVIQESVDLHGETILVREPPSRGKNIRERGLDFRKSDVLIPVGTTINVRDIGLIAASGSAALAVRKRPKIVIFTTGDELVLPGAKPRADQIFSSNSHALEAMAKAWGADVTNLGIVRDDLKATIAAIKKAAAADILITTGGASVGDHDYVQEALKRSGVTIDFWKIALRPGKPLMFGTKGKLCVLGLPGNPVSALVCARLFLKPLLAKMIGLDPQERPVLARLAAPLPANDLRQDYLRATLKYGPDGTRHVNVFSKQDSSMQRSLRNADCLIVREPHAPAAEAGQMVSVLLLDF
ncbi:MAG: molybdopterin molybdotransferase MoeA [Alphaproteobacteria bacterium]|nr:molybdopterin molybdotransferase MoeA [Alphaproteobacteria bacterium]